MSYFSDFDEFLKSQEKSQQEDHSEHIQKILKSRMKQDTTIRSLMDMFKEYYETIIKPRKASLLILKKQEKVPQKTPQKYEAAPYFLYRINVIPTDFLPAAFDPAYATLPYLVSGNITRDDWHANVTMQFDISLVDSWNTNQATYTGELFPMVTIKTWGTIQTDMGELLSSEIHVSHAVESRLPYTQLFIDGQTQQVSEKVKHALMVATPYVFSHRSVVWKK